MSTRGALDVLCAPWTALRTVCLVLCVGLGLALDPADAQAQEPGLDFTLKLLVPWLRPPGWRAAPHLRPLVAAVERAGRGDIRAAEAAIGALAQHGTSSPVSQFALSLHSVIVNRGLSLLGGGTPVQPDTLIAAAALTVKQQRLAPVSVSSSPLLVTLVSAVVTCEHLPAQIGAVLAQRRLDPAAHQPTPQDFGGCLAALDGIFGTSEDLAALRVYRAVMAARLAAALSPEALDGPLGDLEQARTQARSAGLRCAEGYIAMLEGDLRAAPGGSVPTLGYNLLAEESAVRRGILMGRGAAVLPINTSLQTPAAQAQLRAKVKSAYSAAQVAWAGCEGGPAALTLRLAYMTSFSAPAAADGLYLQAARESRAAGDARGAALADVAHSLLSGQDKQRWIADLHDRAAQDDRGAVLSIATLITSYATRRFAVADTQTAKRTLLDVIHALDPPPPWYESAILGAQEVLAWLYLVQDRQGARIAVVEETVRLRRNVVSRAQQAAATYASIAPLIPLEAALLGARAELRGALQALLMARDPATERGARQSLANELAVLDADPRLATPTNPAAGPAPQGDQFQQDVAALEPKSCTDKAAQYPALAQRGQALPRAQSRLSLLRLEWLLMPCGPDHQRQAQALLQEAHPIDALRKLPGAPQSMVAAQEVMATRMQLSFLLGYAAGLELYPLLQEWLSGLEVLMTTEPHLADQEPMTRFYRALLALRQAQDPAKARDLLLPLVGRPRPQTWPAIFTRTMELHLLIEASVRLHDAVAALRAWEHLRMEEATLSELRNGIDPLLPRSARLAALEAKARQGPLSPEEEQERASLETAPSAETQPQLRPPQGEEIVALARALPPGTTVLVYHFAHRMVVLWRLQAGAPPHMQVLAARPDQVERKAKELRDHLATGLPWQDLAHDLYTDLILPAGPLGQGPLVILPEGRLRNLSFEVLGQRAERAPGAKPLGLLHPMFYADRLLERSSEPSCASATGSVVVGVNGSGPGALVNAEREAEAVAQALRTKAIEPDQATQLLLTPRLRAARYIHIAAHGDIVPANPYLSYQELSRGERMEAWWLFSQAQQAEIIVLSGCNTRSTDPTLAARQSILGFVFRVGEQESSIAALLDHGTARWVLASLWEADDPATSDLMKTYYAAISHGAPPPQALLEARRQVASAQTRSFDTNWAPFLLSARSLAAALAPPRPQCPGRSGTQSPGD